MKTLVTLLLLCSSCFGAYSWRGQVDLGTASSGTLNNITLVTVTVSDTHLKTVGNGGTINDASCTHTIINVPCDLIVTDDPACGPGSTAFKWGPEKYDGVAGSLYLWIMTPSLGATHLVAYVCTDDPTIHTYQGGAQGAEWDSNYKAAWHMASATGATIKDFTTSAADGTPDPTNTPTSSSSGQVDGALAFTTLQWAQTATVSHGIGTGDFTFSGWINLSSYTSNGSSGPTVMSNGNFAPWFGVNVMATGHANQLSFYYGGWHNFNTAVSLNTPHYVVLTRSGSTVSAYLDGVAEVTTYTFFNSIANNYFIFGRSSAAGAGDGTNGVVDELRVSNAARPASWIDTEYANQSAPPAITNWTPVGPPPTTTFVPVNIY